MKAQDKNKESVS